MTPKLSPELKSAIDHEHGNPIPVEADGAKYILMSIDAYRALTGIESDSDLADSLAHLKTAMEQVQRGETRPLRDAVDSIAARHGLSS